MKRTFKVFNYTLSLEVVKRAMVPVVTRQQNSVDEETQRMEALRVSQDAANPRPRPSK